MSFEHGWAALHLDKPPVVPRTEYSAEFHWPLIEAVTGRTGLLEPGSPGRAEASAEFMRLWDYAFVWSTLIGADDFGEVRTRMGHAVYASGREDWDERQESAFASPQDVLDFHPMERLPQPPLGELRQRFEAHYRGNLERFPDAVAMTGIYVTCISGLIDLFGWDLLLEACGEDLEQMGRLTDEYGRWIGRYYEALASADVPVVMVHDDLVWSSGPFLPPAWYRKHVFPHYKRCIGQLVESGKRVLFTADGDYTTFVDDIVDCGVHALVMEPMTDMALVAAKYGRTHALVGNVDTRVLLDADPRAVEAEVARCMAIGKDCPGFILAVGNHIPPNTPVEAALVYEAAYRAARVR